MENRSIEYEEGRWWLIAKCLPDSASSTAGAARGVIAVSPRDRNDSQRQGKPHKLGQFGRNLLPFRSLVLIDDQSDQSNVPHQTSFRLSPAIEVAKQVEELACNF
jgi:hypothetical protein